MSSTDDIFLTMNLVKMRSFFAKFIRKQVQADVKLTQFIPLEADEYTSKVFSKNGIKNTQPFLFERKSADDAFRILMTFKISVIFLIFIIAAFHALHFFTLLFIQYCQCVHGMTFRTNPARNKFFSFSVHIPKPTVFFVKYVRKRPFTKINKTNAKRTYF